MEQVLQTEMLIVISDIFCEQIDADSGYDTYYWIASIENHNNVREFDGTRYS